MSRHLEPSARRGFVATGPPTGPPTAANPSRSIQLDVARPTSVSGHRVGGRCPRGGVTVEYGPGLGLPEGFGERVHTVLPRLHGGSVLHDEGYESRLERVRCADHEAGSRRAWQDGRRDLAEPPR